MRRSLLHHTFRVRAYKYSYTQNGNRHVVFYILKSLKSIVGTY
jgi:hypothetical protein